MSTREYPHSTPEYPYEYQTVPLEYPTVRCEYVRLKANSDGPERANDTHPRRDRLCRDWLTVPTSAPGLDSLAAHICAKIDTVRGAVALPLVCVDRSFSAMTCEYHLSML